MRCSQLPKIAIIDYGLGNLFSIKQACIHAGLQATITASKSEILAANGVILPGVGAFGDAMNALKRLDLVTLLKDFASTDKPIVGICLGMQLLMNESYEFGIHKGLGIIEGVVLPFRKNGETFRVKVPHIGWNQIFCSKESIPSWSNSLLQGLPEGGFMYFVHSFYVEPNNSNVILSRTIYGEEEFCSSLKLGNISAFQYHPERSGKLGLRIYENLAGKLESR